MPSILIVDDELDILEVLEQSLQDRGMEVTRASSAEQALDLLRTCDFDLVISDIKLPVMSGVDLLKEAKKLVPDTIFIMITAQATRETAIEALQHDAYDFLTKPLKLEEVGRIVQKALEKKIPRHEVASPKKDIEVQQSHQQLFHALQSNQIVGKSQKMTDVHNTIGTVATGDSTVLIYGESGTGKELVARAIHEASGRKDQPFVSINCGAFPETLLESELFGYMKGAFTGAQSNRKGLFESANGGSIFLDEIGDMTPPMQVKLLRVLQERKLRPLGGTNEVSIDVRVIAATNRDLKEAIEQGQFRGDLYYRIAVITIELPPLRERVEDIELLVNHFREQQAKKANKKISGISPDALLCLQTYQWPGNIRELENTIERAITLETTEVIQIDRLPDAVRGLGSANGPHNRSVAFPEGSFDIEVFMSTLERSFICRTMELFNGNQTLAAQHLKLTKPSLRHKLQALGIDPGSFKRPTSSS